MPERDLALLLRLNQSWFEGIPADELYGVTRAWWVMSAASAERVKRVLAVAGGVVREAYTPHTWVTSPVTGLENRIGFEGEVSSNREDYVGRDVAHLFRPGSANPVRYLPLDALGTPAPVTDAMSTAPPGSAAQTGALLGVRSGIGSEPGLLERVLPLLHAFEGDLTWAQSRAAQELFHSNTLAWLLSTHPVVLSPLLGLLGGTAYDGAEEVRVAREMNHLDLTIDPVGATPKVVVENKLYSIPNPEQLRGYSSKTLPWSKGHGAEGAPGTRYVLLSLMTPSFELPPPWVHVDYAQVAEALDRVDGAALGEAADVFGRYRALVHRLVALAEAVDPAQNLDEPFSAVPVVGQLPGGSLDGAVYRTRISGLAQVVQALLEAPKSFVVEGGRSGAGLMSYWRRIGPTRQIGWQYEVSDRQLRYQLTIEDPDLQGTPHAEARAVIAETEHADFFDHSDLESLLGADLKPKSYAPGKWNRFNPDFVYRHRPLTPTAPTATLAVALAEMTRRVDVYADQVGYDPGSRGSIGREST